MDANGNSEARIGAGTEFWLADGTGTLVELDEVTEIPFADETADDVEVTHYKSPKRRKEYKAGLIEPGEGAIVVNYIPGSPTDVLLKAAHADGKVRAYKAVLPDEDGEPAYEITGYLIVKSRGKNVPIGDRMTQSVSVRFTGAVEEAAAEAPAP